MIAIENSDEKQMTAPEYIRANFHPLDRIAVVVRKRGRGEIIQRITTADRVAAASFQDWLHFKNEKDNCDVYIAMNALKSESHTRTKDGILAIRHLYLDLDRDGAKSFEAIEKSTLVPKPSYVLQTALDQFQVIWKVEEITQPQAEALLRALATQFDSHPAAIDTTTVLRLPGFSNRELDDDFLVRVHTQTGQTHHPRDFKLRTESVDPAPTKWNQPERPASPIRDSQSIPTATIPAAISTEKMTQPERDLLYAKRALANGDPPADIIRTIAEFRSDHHPNPQAYASHTVSQAQTELRGGG